MREAVKLSRKIVALTVLAAWLPATSHCLLAGAGAMTDACCSDSQETPPNPSHDDCGVCDVENGNFKLADSDYFQFTFHSTSIWQLQLPAAPEFANHLSRPQSDRAPPDLTRWHFQTRAALPPRAPSIL